MIGDKSLSVVNSSNLHNNQINDRSQVNASSILPFQNDKSIHNSGKLYKGFINSSQKKIPLNCVPYSSKNSENEQPNGFGGSSLRFREQISFNPGPCYYHYSEESPSSYGKGISKFGKEQRSVFEQKYVNEGPAVGSYNVESDQKHENQKSKKKRGSSFLSKYAKQAVFQPVLNPAPGQYETELQHKVISYQSAFLTNSKRDQYIQFKKTPSPGTYNLSKDLKSNSSVPHKGNSRVFAQSYSTLKKIQSQDIIKKFYDEFNYSSQGQLLPKFLKQDSSIGPGSYELSKMSQLQIGPLQPSQSACFVQGVQDRFGTIIKKDNVIQNNFRCPSPTRYDIQKYGIGEKNKEKNTKSSAEFVSQCIRQPYGDFDKKLGPNFQLPPVRQNNQKKNFNLNLEKKWI